MTAGDSLPPAAVPCPICGFDLRGHAGVDLENEVRCPECNSIVDAYTAGVIAWSRAVTLRRWHFTVVLIPAVTAIAINVLGLH